MIGTTRNGHVMTLEMQREDRRNALNCELVDSLREAIEQAAADDVHAIVITGAGNVFSSGADLTDAAGMAEKLPDKAKALNLAIDVAPIPVIGAINGPAIGGGFCLAVATDIRIASETAYFRAAGINNGLTASELGISYLLPRAIGASRAFEIMLSGRDVDAAEAERIGLVSRTVPAADVLDACYELAARIAGFSRVGVEATKRLLWSSLDAGSLHSHMDHEGHAQLFVRMTTQNFEEAIIARREGRPPVFLD
jgi:enoyl-CoA hydratase